MEDALILRSGANVLGHLVPVISVDLQGLRDTKRMDRKGKAEDELKHSGLMRAAVSQIAPDEQLAPCMAASAISVCG